jgi:hypothetical protein
VGQLDVSASSRIVIRKVDDYVERGKCTETAWKDEKMETRFKWEVV